MVALNRHMFKKFTLDTPWRQFARVEINFHPQLTILTGANSSGKTTILNLLSYHFGWTPNLISTPKMDSKNGILEYLSDVLERFFKKEESTPMITVGSVSFSDGKEDQIRVPRQVQQTYSISLSSNVRIPGLYIPSHRPAYAYQSIVQIPTKVPTGEELFDSYGNEVRNRHQSGGGGIPPNFFIKQALVSLVALGYGNRKMVVNNEATRLFEGFEAVLRTVLP